MSTILRRQLGSENSFGRGTLPMETLTSDPSAMCSPPTLTGTPSATSSQASEAGVTPSVSPDGRMMSLSGQVPARVNLSARQAKAQGLLTSATYGLTSIGLSSSADLQQSLENRLRQKMGASGSPEYVLTWKQWPMMSGVPICALRGSALVISGHGYGGLPTPNASDNRNRGSLGRTPSVTRRKHLGKQIGLSMLFDGMPCPSCVAAMMGYPSEWLLALSQALGTQSCRKSPQRLSKRQKKPDLDWL